MILDAVDQLDELQEQEHVLTDTLEDTFELLRQQYYESTSLGDGYDFSRVSSGVYFLVFFGACARGLASRCTQEWTAVLNTEMATVGIYT